MTHWIVCHFEYFVLVETNSILLSQHGIVWWHITQCRLVSMCETGTLLYPWNSHRSSKGEIDTTFINKGGPGISGYLNLSVMTLITNESKIYPENIWSHCVCCEYFLNIIHYVTISVTITDASRVSEIFNDFFVNVATDIGFNDDVVSASDAIKRHDQHPSVKRIREYYRDKIKDFDFHVVDTETVMQMIKNINHRKATGCDNIPGKLIRIAHREISIPICSLLNASIAAKRFPSIMKYADVSPCFKKEDNLFKGNYRPVSVLTVISKLYESVLNNQMVDHLSELFNTLLSAFRKHYNCQSLLLKLIEDIKSALDKGHKTGAVFMDLSKAFDCLPHALLLAKLNAYGLSTAVCELMSSYLNQRMQRVKISNCRSSWKILNKGVPQGSILGPLLFNVFMNDMFLFMERCNLYNYADDNSIIYSSPDIETVILNLKHDCQNAIQ